MDNSEFYHIKGLLSNYPRYTVQELNNSIDKLENGKFLVIHGLEAEEFSDIDTAISFFLSKVHLET